MELSKTERENLMKRIEELELEKRRLEKELHERNIVEEDIHFAWAGNLGRWEWYVKENRVDANPLKAGALGFDMGELSPGHQGFTDRIHPEDYERTMEVMRRHLRGEEPVYEVEYRIRTKDGRWKWFYDRGVVVERDEEGAPVHLTGIVFDITPQKEAEAELKRSQKELEEALATKNRFFSIIAHDLKSPFNVFLGYTELMKSELGELSPEEIGEFAADIHSSAVGLFRLLQNLLEWANLQQGLITIRRERIELDGLVRDALGLLTLTAEEKGITFEVNIPPRITVTADTNALGTVMRNLISNAVKFSHSGGTVEINAYPEERDSVRIEVRDIGIGMSEELKTRLFNVESTEPRSGTADERGTGLGLVLCKELIEMMGGILQVESRENEGSTLSFNLPAG
jgi:PAS domain S-box-containing protein